MKKIILMALAIIFLAVPVSYGQALSITTEWTREFDFGNNGTSDQFFGMVFDQSGNFYLGGINSGLSSSALMKMNPSGFVIWSKTDTMPGAGIGRGQIFYLESKNKVGYFSSYQNKWFVTRNPPNGNLLEIVPKNFSFSFAPYGVGDSIVAVETGSSDNVMILDEHGNIGRQFPIGENINGYCEVRVMGNHVWLFAAYLSINALIAKYDLATGQQLWRKNIFGMIQPRGDVDSLGNSYFSCSKKDSIENYYRSKSMKFSQNGTILWDKEILVNPQWGPNGNINILNSTIAVNLSEGYVATGMQVQKNQTNDGWTLAYFMLRKIQNGDTLHSEKFANKPSAQLNGVKQISFRPNSKMLVLGFQLMSTNPGWMRQYIVDTLVTTSNSGNGQVPEIFSLFQNYPNPFNPSTKIEFSIPKRTLVNIKVYDVLGKEVQTLVNEIKPIGNYSVKFNGSNLPSGTYFYRIDADGYAETKKMTLVK